MEVGEKVQVLGESHSSSSLVGCSQGNPFLLFLASRAQCLAMGKAGSGGRVPPFLLPFCGLNRKETKVPFWGGLSVSMSVVAEPPGGKAFEVFPWEMVANKSAVGWYWS